MARISTRDDGVKVIAVNLRLDVDAHHLLQQFSPCSKGYGRFLSRLIYEYDARRQGRQEERERIAKQLVGAGDVA
jgi:hypothetical protein